jgi:hypothetical protein
MNVKIVSASVCCAALAALLSVPGSSQAGGSRALPEKVTFTEHVAPILFNNCARCHRPGEAAPFSLLTFEDARKRGKQIAEATTERFMPPWHADPGYLTYSNERRLTEDQIALIKEWHKQGMAEGDPKKLPTAPKFAEGWQLGEPDMILKMPEAFEVPAEGKDLYWNFRFPMNLTEEKYVTAIEFRPGARKVVHHSLYFMDTSGTARNYDEKDPKPGYNGMNHSNKQFTSLGGWALGGEPLMLPPELAWTFPTNAEFVIQTHFHPSGKVEQEVSMIGLHFAKKPPARKFAMVQLPPVFGRLSAIDIPAGQSNYVVKDSFTLPIDMDAFSISPHAHYLAKTFHLAATLPDGRTQTLLKISDWDFNWQEDCAFKDRVHLPKGTRLDATVTYDNSETNPHQPTHPPKRVQWGPFTTDELAALTLNIIPAQDEQLDELKQELRAHNIDLFIDRAQEDEKQKERVAAMKAAYDKNGNDKIDPEERPALRAFLEQSGLLRGF